jgi:hypothetical protein
MGCVAVARLLGARHPPLDQHDPLSRVIARARVRSILIRCAPVSIVATAATLERDFNQEAA